MDPRDQSGELLVVAQALAFAASVPGIETAPRDLVAPAQKRHSVLGAVLGYELEFRLRRSILKRMAFFKRSCSTWSAASLRSSLRASARASTLSCSCFTWRFNAPFSGSFGARSTCGRLKPAAFAAGLSLPSRKSFFHLESMN